MESKLSNGAWLLGLATLKSKLSEEVYTKWIKPLKIHAINEFQITLIVPSHLDEEELSHAYLGLIEHSFEEANNKEIKIKFQKQSIPSKSHEPSVPFTSVPAIELNQVYTFDEFVVGNNSQFAYSAAMAVAKDIGGTKFNPLLICGGVGLGKTHLLQAIGNFVLHNHPDKKVRYVTSENFYREFVDSIQHNRISELSTFYRNEVDLLLMDDVQFLSGKDRTQEEFFHIFNALHQLGKQIVLSSDNPPNQLKGLEDRLVSRFQWGLFVDVQTPDRETREAILKKKAASHKLDISEDIISFLAESIEDNVRILEGAIRQLLLQSSLKREDITIDLAKEIVSRMAFTHKTRDIKAEDITNIVSDYFTVEVNKILERGRGSKEVAQARQVAMFLQKELTSASLKTIGKRFGDRDHSTVVHAVKTIERAMEKDDLFKKRVDGIMERLRAQ
ncbi:MAG: chromosomal replication initiator protein DnaA [Fibrobacteria bacterium]|nr:chromosomal replication initiator protein DnaA [Fibrobacteria bacterium]